MSAAGDSAQPPDGDRRDAVPGRRQDDWGRPVYSRSPIMRWLLLGTFVNSVLALVALAAAGVFTVDHLGDIDKERWRSYVDTCYAIRVTAQKAVSPAHHHYIIAVLRDAGLSNCVGNAYHLTGLTQAQAQR